MELRPSLGSAPVVQRGQATSLVSLSKGSTETLQPTPSPHAPLASPPLLLSRS